jgi:hypothetical protein
MKTAARAVLRTGPVLTLQRPCLDSLPCIGHLRGYPKKSAENTDKDACRVSPCHLPPCSR